MIKSLQKEEIALNNFFRIFVFLYTIKNKINDKRLISRRILIWIDVDEKIQIIN